MILFNQIKSNMFCFFFLSLYFTQTQNTTLFSLHPSLLFLSVRTTMAATLSHLVAVFHFLILLLLLLMVHGFSNPFRFSFTPSPQKNATIFYIFIMINSDVDSSIIFYSNLIYYFIIITTMYFLMFFCINFSK